MIPPVLGNIVPNQKNKRKYYDLYEWNKIYYTPIPKPLKNQLKRFKPVFFKIFSKSNGIIRQNK